MGAKTDLPHYLKHYVQYEHHHCNSYTGRTVQNSRVTFISLYFAPKGPKFFFEHWMLVYSFSVHSCT